MKHAADLLVNNCGQLLTLASTDGKPRVGSALGDLAMVRNGALAAQGGKIVAAGPREMVESAVDLSPGAEVLDAGGAVVMPGFVDCHTHVVFGKSRSREYALKMTRTAAEIERMGITTGIPASILMTRDSSEEELFAQASDRLMRMLACGTTTAESKSGYGISWPDELKMLTVNRRLNEELPLEIVSTFVGAHDFPPEIDREDPSARDAYIRELTGEMIPRTAQEKLAEFCDVYCDIGYYTADEAETVLRSGMDHGLKPRIHTDAYKNIGGSTLAAELPAVSADHLNYTTGDEMKRMADAGVIGVLLPALDFAVAHPDPVDARAFADAGVTLALGTNLNPGNWTESMQLVMQFACRNYHMSPEEAMLAATVGGARVLGREKRIGALAPRMQADIQLWNIPSFEDLIYRIGNNAVRTVIKAGRVVVRSERT
jgi:imidazolonepropionase